MSLNSPISKTNFQDIVTIVCGIGDTDIVVVVLS